MRTSGELVFRVCMLLLGQDVLREKQQHIEQLLKERDLERAEITRAASQADEAEHRFVTLKQEFEQYRAQCEIKVRENAHLLSQLNVDRQQLLSALEDEKRKNEDLQFRFEEAAISKNDFEATNEIQVRRIRDLEKQLADEHQKSDSAEGVSNRLFEAEEGLIKAREEIDTLRSELEESKKNRHALEEEKTISAELVDSLRKQIAGMTVEKEDKEKTANNLNEHISKITSEHEVFKREAEASRAKSDENCMAKDAEIETLKAKLAHSDELLKEKLKIIEQLEEANTQLTKENAKLKMEVSAKSLDLETALENLSKKEGEFRSTLDKEDTEKSELDHKVKDLERHNENLQEVETTLRRELDETRENLKNKITEVENVKKDMNVHVSQMDLKLQEANKTIAQHHDEIKKLNDELVEAKNKFEESKNEIHSRHARQVASQDTQLMALSAEIQQKNEEVTRLSIVVSKLEEDLCTKNSIIETLRLQLESYENGNSSHAETIAEANKQLHECQLSFGEVQRKLEVATERITMLTEVKQRLEVQIQALTVNAQNGAHLEELRRELQTKEALVEGIRAEFTQKLQISERSRHELELNLQNTVAELERLKVQFEEKLRVSGQAEALLKQRCDTSLAEMAKIRDEFRVKVDELEHALQQKEILLASLQSKCSESEKYHQEQLRTTTEQLNRSLQVSQDKLAELGNESQQLKQQLAAKAEEIIEAEAKRSHVVAQAQQAENELKARFGEDIKRLQFELNEKTVHLEKVTTEIQLLRTDCQNTSGDLSAKDHQISELATELQRYKTLIAQLEQQLNEARLQQQQSLKGHEESQNQTKDLLEQVAMLTEKVQSGEAVYHNLQIEHTSIIQLMERLKITEQQKQQCLFQLENEIKAGGENQNCSHLRELLDQMKFANVDQNAEKILELQKQIEIFKNQLFECNHQFETQKNEILRLQEELLKARQTNGNHAGGAQDRVSFKTTQHNTTPHAPLSPNPLELQVQLVMIKNSFGQLSVKFEALQNENSVLVARLQNALNNGNVKGASDIIQQFVHIRQQFNSVSNVIQTANYQFQKTIQYSLLQLQNKDKALNVQLIQNKNLQEILQGLPVQCKQFTVPKLNDFGVNNESAGLNINCIRLEALLDAKEQRVLELQQQISSLLVECAHRLYKEVKPPNVPAKPWICPPLQHQIHKVPTVTTGPPKIIRIFVPVPQPQIVIRKILVPQFNGKRCPAPRVERVEVPKTYVEKVPFPVEVPAKCGLPDLTALYNCAQPDQIINTLDLSAYPNGEIFKFKQSLLSLVTRQRSCAIGSGASVRCPQLPSFAIPQGCVTPTQIVTDLVLNGYSLSATEAYKQSLLQLLIKVQQCDVSSGNVSTPDIPLRNIFDHQKLVLVPQKPKIIIKQIPVRVSGDCKPVIQQVPVQVKVPVVVKVPVQVRQECRLPQVDINSCEEMQSQIESLTIPNFSPLEVLRFKQNLLSILTQQRTCGTGVVTPKSFISQVAMLRGQCHLPTININSCEQVQNQIELLTIPNYSPFEVQRFKRNLLAIVTQQRSCSSGSPPTLPAATVPPSTCPPTKVIRIKVPSRGEECHLPAININSCEQVQSQIESLNIPNYNPFEVLNFKRNLLAMATQLRTCGGGVRPTKIVHIPVKVPIRVPIVVKQECHLPDIQLNSCENLQRQIESVAIPNYNQLEVQRFKENLVSIIMQQRTCSSATTRYPVYPQDTVDLSRECHLPLININSCTDAQSQIAALSIPNYNLFEVQRFKQNLLSIVQSICSAAVTPSGPTPTCPPPQVIKVPVPGECHLPSINISNCGGIQNQIDSLSFPNFRAAEVTQFKQNLLSSFMQTCSSGQISTGPPSTCPPARIVRIKEECHLPNINVRSCEEVPNRINSLNFQGYNNLEVQIFKENLLFALNSCSATGPPSTYRPPNVIRVPVKVPIAVPGQCHLPNIYLNSCENVQNQIESMTIPNYNPFEVHKFKQNLLLMIMQQRSCSSGTTLPPPTGESQISGECRLPQINLNSCEAAQSQIASLSMPNYNPFEVENFKQNLLSIVHRACNAPETTIEPPPSCPPPRIVEVSGKCELPFLNLNTCGDIQNQVATLTIPNYNPFQVNRFKQNLLSLFLQQRRCGSESVSTEPPPTSPGPSWKTHIRMECHLPQINVDSCEEAQSQIASLSIPNYNPLEVETYKQNLLAMFGRICSVGVSPTGPQSTSPPRFIKVPIPGECHLPSININSCREVQNQIDSLSFPNYNQVEVATFKQNLLSAFMQTCSSRQVSTEPPSTCPPAKIITVDREYHLPNINVRSCEEVPNRINSLHFPGYNPLEVQMFKENLLFALNSCSVRSTTGPPPTIRPPNVIRVPVKVPVKVPVIVQGECHLPFINVNNCGNLQSQVDSMEISSYNPSEVLRFKHNLLSALMQQRRCSLQTTPTCPPPHIVKVPVPGACHLPFINVNSCEQVQNQIESLALPNYSPFEVQQFKQNLLSILMQQRSCGSTAAPSLVINNCHLPSIDINSCEQLENQVQSLTITNYSPIEVQNFKQNLLSILQRMCIFGGTGTPIPYRTVCHLPDIRVYSCGEIPAQIEALNIPNFSPSEVHVFKQNLMSVLMHQRNCNPTTTPNSSTCSPPQVIRGECHLPHISINSCENIQNEIGSLNMPNYSPFEIQKFKENLLSLLMQQRTCTIRPPSTCPPPKVVKQIVEVPKVIMKEVVRPPRVIVQKVPVRVPSPPRIIVKHVKEFVDRPCSLPNINVSGCGAVEEQVASITLPNYSLSDVRIFKQNLLSILVQQRMCSTTTTGIPPTCSPPRFIKVPGECHLPDININSCTHVRNEIASLSLPNYSQFEVQRFKQSLLSMLLQQRTCSSVALPTAQSTFIPPPTTCPPPQIIRVPIPQKPQVIIREVPVNVSGDCEPIIRQVPVHLRVPVQVPVYIRTAECHLPTINVNSCVGVQNQIESLSIPNYNPMEVSRFKQNLLSILIQQRSCSIGTAPTTGPPSTCPPPQIVKVPVPVRVKGECHLPMFNINSCDVRGVLDSLIIDKYNPFEVRQFKQNLLSMLMQQRDCHVRVKPTPIPPIATLPPSTCPPPQVIEIPVPGDCHLPVLNVNSCRDIRNQITSLNLPNYNPLEVQAFKENLLFAVTTCSARLSSKGHTVERPLKVPAVSKSECHLPDISVNSCGDVRQQIESLTIPNYNEYEVQKFKQNLFYMLMQQRTCVSAGSSTCPPAEVVKVPIPLKVPVPVKNECHLPKINIDTCGEIQSQIESLSVSDNYNPFEIQQFKQDLLSMFTQKRTCTPFTGRRDQSGNQCYLPFLDVNSCGELQSQVESLSIPNYNPFEVHKFKQNLLAVLTQQRMCSSSPPTKGTFSCPPPQTVKVPVYVPQKPQVIIKTVRVPVPVKNECRLPNVYINSCGEVQQQIESLSIPNYDAYEVQNFKRNLFASLMQQRTCNVQSTGTPPTCPPPQIIRVPVPGECHLPKINIDSCEAVQSQIASLHLPNNNYNPFEVHQFKQDLLSVVLQQRTCSSSSSTTRVPFTCPPPQILRVPVYIPQKPEVIIREVPINMTQECKPVIQQVPVHIKVPVAMKVPVKSECHLPSININSCAEAQYQIQSLSIPNYDAFEVQNFKQSLLSMVMKTCISPTTGVPPTCPPPQIIRVPRECHLPMININTCGEVRNQIESLTLSDYNLVEIQQFKQNLWSTLLQQRACNKTPTARPLSCPPPKILRIESECHLPDISIPSCGDVQQQIQSLAMSNVEAFEVEKFKQNLFYALMQQRSCVVTPTSPSTVCPPPEVIKVPVPYKVTIPAQVSGLRLPDININSCEGVQSQIEALSIPNYDQHEVQRFKQSLLTLIMNQRTCTSTASPPPIHRVPTITRECRLPYINVNSCGDLQNQIESLHIPNYNPAETSRFKQNLLSVLWQQRMCSSATTTTGPLPTSPPPKIIKVPQVIIRQVPVEVPKNCKPVIQQVPVQVRVPVPVQVKGECHLPNFNVNSCEGVQNQIESLTIPDYDLSEVQNFKQNLLSMLMLQRNCRIQSASPPPVLYKRSQECHLPKININSCVEVQSLIDSLTIPNNYSPFEVMQFKQSILELVVTQRSCNLRTSTTGIPSTCPPPQIVRIPVPVPSDQRECRLPDISFGTCGEVHDQINSLEIPNYSSVEVQRFKQNLLSMFIHQRNCDLSRTLVSSDLVDKTPRLRSSECHLPKLYVDNCTGLENQIESLNLPTYGPAEVSEFKQNLLSILLHQRACNRPTIVDKPIYIRLPPKIIYQTKEDCPTPRYITTRVPVFLPCKETTRTAPTPTVFEPPACRPIIQKIPVVVKQPSQVITKQVPVYIKISVPVRVPQIVEKIVTKKVIEQVPVPQPPRMVEKQVPVRVEVPPKIVIKKILVPLLNGTSCPPPRVVVEKVPVPQPPQIITKPVIVRVQSPKISYKEVSAPFTGGHSFEQNCSLPVLPIPETCVSPESYVQQLLASFSAADSIFRNSLLQLLKQQYMCGHSNQNSGLVTDNQKNIEFYDKVTHYRSLLCFYKKQVLRLKHRLHTFLHSSSCLDNYNIPLRSSHVPAVPIPMMHVIKSVTPSIPLKPFQHVMPSGITANNAYFVQSLRRVFKNTQEALQYCMDAILAQSLTQSQINSKCNNCHQLVQDNEMAENQIKFLNSIIVDIQRKNEEQKARIEVLESGYSPAMADELKLIGSSHQRQIPPRVYCDICEEFDLHETEDCPKQDTDLGQTNPFRGHKQLEERPYCELCETFGHSTEDCPEDQTF